MEMKDRKTVMSWLEGLTQDDWEVWYSDSEVQETAKAALELLKEQEAEAEWIYGESKTGVDGWYCSECNFFEPWFYEFTKDIDFIRFYGHCPKCGRIMTSYTGKPTQERR